MKKYFIFAAIATAGLFASCSSSDDVAVSGGQEPIENPEAREAIRLNLATPTAMITRGTGTVGGVGKTGDADTHHSANFWSGQSINVFMFTKGTEAGQDTYEAVPDGTTLTSGTKYYTSATGDGEFTSDGTEVADGTNFYSKTPGAAADAHATTLNLTKNPDYSTTNNTVPQYLYNNLEMITPGSAANKIPGEDTDADGSGEAMIHDGTINYYPPAGNYDFFGYHVDGANGTAGVDMTTAPTTLWTIPFTINGTQDLMSTKAELTGETTDATSQAGIMNAAGTRKLDYYSAYAARKKVHPTLTFKHLLTRLQFSVKAGNDKAAGYEEATAAVYFTDQADVDAYNANTTNVPGALDPSTAYTAYSFTSYAHDDHTHQYGTGKVVVLSQDATYTVVKVIENSVPGFVGNIYEVQGTTLDVGTYYNLLENDGNHTATTIDALITASTTNEAEIKAYNESLPGAKHVGDVKTPATGGLTIENAVYVKSIQVLSEKTKGKLAVAWTAPAAEMQDYQKITWDDEQPSADITVTTGNRWLTLMERPYAYKMKTGAAAATYTDLAAYANMTAAEYAALGDNTTPTKQTVDDAVATLTSNITNTVYQTLSVAGMAKYEVDTDVNVDNEQLQALTPTAPGIDVNETTPADRYPTKRVGESIILSPGTYSSTGVAQIDNANTTKLKMKVKLAQKVPTNWNTPTVRSEREQDLDLEILAPAEGFKQNYSYNIILTVYGLERIEVIAVVEPWIDGGNIGVGADD